MNKYINLSDSKNIIGCYWVWDFSIVLTMPFYLYNNLIEFYKENKVQILNDLKFNRYKYDIIIDLDFFYIFDFIFTINNNNLLKYHKDLYWCTLHLDNLYFILKQPIIQKAFWNIFYIILNNFYFFFNKNNYLLCLYCKSMFINFFKNYNINLKFNKLKKIKIKNLNFKNISNSNFNWFSSYIIYIKNFNNIILNWTRYNMTTLYLASLKFLLKKLIILEIDKNFIFLIYIIFYCFNGIQIINIKNLKLNIKDYKTLKFVFCIKKLNFYNFDKKKLKKLKLKKLILLLINLVEFKMLGIRDFNLNNFIEFINLIIYNND